MHGLRDLRWKKEITVSEIYETAKINRSTFYDHYADVLALMKACSAKIEKQVEAQPHADGAFAWIFEYIKANADIFKNYFKLGMYSLEHILPSELILENNFQAILSQLLDFFPSQTTIFLYLLKSSHFFSI